MEIFVQLTLNSLFIGALYTLIAIGFNLAYGTTKFFNMAHGSMAVIAAYGVFYFNSSLGLNIPLSIILSILLAGLIGVLLDKGIFLRLRKKQASNMILLVASLGLFTLIEAIIAMFFSSQFHTLGATNYSAPTVYNIFGGVLTQIQLYTIIAAIVCTLAVMYLLKKTTFGKAVRAVSDEKQVAEIIGINTNRIILYVFFISSALAGIGGIFYGFDTGIEPTMGMQLLLKGIIGGIIGGIGSIQGALIGSFLLGFIENFGIWKISAEWRDAISFGVLIIFLIFRPQGIFKK